MKYSSQQRQRGKLFKCTIKEKPGDRDGVQYFNHCSEHKGDKYLAHAVEFSFQRVDMDCLRLFSLPFPAVPSYYYKTNKQTKKTHIVAKNEMIKLSVCFCLRSHWAFPSSMVEWAAEVASEEKQASDSVWRSPRKECTYCHKPWSVRI